MRIRIRQWYDPFENGWKLCSYETKSQGYDEMSHHIHDFKDGKPVAVQAFTEWSIDELAVVLPDLEIDYSIRALGRFELLAQNSKPLHKLASDVSEVFGMQFIPDLIAKTRTTKHLVGLSKVEREAELGGVFRLNRQDVNLNGASLLLIDDVKTSGTTSTYIRDVILEKYPEARVYLFVLAKANHGGNTNEVFVTYNKFANRK